MCASGRGSAAAICCDTIVILISHSIRRRGIYSAGCICNQGAAFRAVCRIAVPLICYRSVCVRKNIERFYIRRAITDNILLNFRHRLFDENRRSLICGFMEGNRVCTIDVTITISTDNDFCRRLGICQIDGSRFTGLSWRIIYSDCIAGFCCWRQSRRLRIMAHINVQMPGGIVGVTEQRTACGQICKLNLPLDVNDIVLRQRLVFYQLLQALIIDI